MDPKNMINLEDLQVIDGRLRLVIGYLGDDKVKVGSGYDMLTQKTFVLNRFDQLASHIGVLLTKLISDILTNSKGTGQIEIAFAAGEYPLSTDTPDNSELNDLLQKLVLKLHTAPGQGGGINPLSMFAFGPHNTQTVDVKPTVTSGAPPTGSGEKTTVKSNDS